MLFQSLSRFTDIISERPVLLVAAHCDDAALSCGALLVRETPVDILTVFAGTPEAPWPSRWDLKTGFGDSTESVRARRAEEEKAFAGTPHRLAFLDLIDSAYVGAARGHDAVRAIRLAIRSWLDHNEEGVIAVPAGAGQRPGRIASRARRVARIDVPARHPDHIVVRDAALDVICAGRADGLLYEELPYLWGKRADDEVRRIGRRRAVQAEAMDVPVNRATKAKRLAIYASQMPHLAVGERRPDRPEDLPAIERYWFVRSLVHAVPPQVRQTPDAPSSSDEARATGG
jgi:LmbE family N-acetylglucosaminyl deacetylase